MRDDGIDVSAMEGEERKAEDKTVNWTICESCSRE